MALPSKVRRYGGFERASGTSPAPKDTSLTERTRSLARLARLSRWTSFRLRLSEVLDRATTLALVPMLYAVAGLTIVKVLRGGPALTHRVALGALIPLSVFVVGLVHAALKSRAGWRGSLALDRERGLADRVTNALAFSSLPEGSRSPMMEAAIDDAVALSRDVSPRRAAPIRVPKDLGALVALGAGLVVIALFEAPVQRFVPPSVKHVDAMNLSPDDIDLFRKMSEDVNTATTDAAAAAEARRFNQLVEDLAERRLDRSEVYRRLDELERSVKEPIELDAAALDESLEAIAKELDKSQMAKPVARALSEKKLADAEQAMRDLAKKVEEAKRDVDKAKLESLKSAMKKSAETVRHDDKSTKHDEARKSLEETRKRLLEKKQKQGLTKEEKDELERTERQLERLDRQKQKQDAQQQQLSGLDRDLAKAAEDLMKDLGQSSEDIKRGAEDINRTAQKQMSEEQKRELLKKIEEMRQILRQEGQAGRDRLKRMMSFGQRAHGGQGQDGREGQQGKSGKGMGEGQEGEGKNGKKLGMGQLRPGGDTVVMMPGGGSIPGEGQGSQSESESGGGDKGGDQWGSGHDPNVRGNATKLKGQTEDVTAAGADTGQGASASQSIYGAAERGFVGRGYKKVYTDYHTVAEEVLGHDEIPPGYRFYVRRYFQLIRPRD